MYVVIRVSSRSRCLQPTMAFRIRTCLSGSEKIIKYRLLWFKNHSWLQSLCWLLLAVFRIRTCQAGFVIIKYSHCDLNIHRWIPSLCQWLCLKHGQALLSNLTQHCPTLGNNCQWTHLSRDGCFESLVDHQWFKVSAVVSQIWAGSAKQPDSLRNNWTRPSRFVTSR